MGGEDGEGARGVCVAKETSEGGDGGGVSRVDVREERVPVFLLEGD